MTTVLEPEEETETEPLGGWDTGPDPVVEPLQEAVPPETPPPPPSTAATAAAVPAATSGGGGAASTIPFPRHQSAVADYNENGDMTKARLLEIRRRMIEIYDATPELQHLPRPDLEVGFMEAVSARRAAKKKKQQQPGVESVKSSGYGQGSPTRPKNRHALSPGGSAKKAAAAGAGSGKKKKTKRAPATRQQQQQQQQRRPFSPASARGGQSRRRDVL